MAGGGGAASTEISAWVSNPYGLILVGRTGVAGAAPGFDWTGAATANVGYESGDTYATQPSMLRYIKERGITDVGGNPYEGVSTPNIEEELDEVKDSVDDIVSLVSDIRTFTEHATDAVTEAGTVVASVDIDGLFSTVISAAISQAATAITETVTQALVASGTLADGIISGSQSLESEISSGADSASRSRTLSLAGDAKTNAISFGSESLDLVVEKARIAITNSGPEALQNAKDILTATREYVQPSMYMYDAANVAKAAAGECISLAIGSAKDAIEDDVVSDIVLAFRNEALKTHLRGAGRFAAGMADIGAVNSSAFVWGMALLESDLTNSVNKFQGEVRYKLFSEAFVKFADIFNANVNFYTQIYSAQMEIFGRSHGQHGQLVSSIMGQFVSVYAQAFADYLNSYAKDRSESTQVLGLAVGAKKELASTFAGMQAETANNIFRSYFDGSVREGLDKRAQHVSYVTNATSQSISKEVTDIEVNKAATMLMLETARIRSVALKEEFDSNLEIDVNAAHWDLELFQIAGNVIGSASGAVVHRPGKPSKAQSVLGGALAAASIAAAIPTGGASLAATWPLYAGAAAAGAIGGATL